MKDFMIAINFNNHKVYEFTFTTISSPALNLCIKLGLSYKDESFNLWEDYRHINVRGKVDLGKLCTVINKNKYIL